MFSFAFEGRLLSANYYPVGARMNGHKYWPIIKEILLLIYISIVVWLKISFIKCILRISGAHEFISYTINILWYSVPSHAVNFCNQLHCEQYISLFYELQVWRVRKRVGWLHPNETNCWWMGANISNRKFAQGRCLSKKWSYCVITILWLHLQWCTTWWE